MKCPKCQAENPDGVKFCGECGSSVSTELTCPRCGHENLGGVKFCHECGQSLTRPVASHPKTSAAQEPCLLPKSL